MRALESSLRSFVSGVRCPTARQAMPAAIVRSPLAPAPRRPRRSSLQLTRSLARSLGAEECSFSECSGEHPYIGVLQQGIADEYELQVRAVMREQRCTDSLLVEMMLLFSSSAVLMWSCLGLICCSATCGLPAMIVGFLFIRAAEQVEFGEHFERRRMQG